MKNLLISFSGGRTSAFMCKLILESPRYKDYKKLFVFANTGKEKEETLQFVNECDKEFDLNLVWLEADIPQKKGIGTKFKIVDFETANRSGKPFEDLIKKFGLPSKLYRHCTRDLKQIPIHKYAKSIFGKKYLTAIGIRADEPHRISNKEDIIYPLFDFNITEQIVRSFWERQRFDLQLKDYQGNCDLCFLKSKRKKLTILSEDPNISKWWEKMESAYQSDLQPQFDMINNFSIVELLENSNKPFRKALDKHELSKHQKTFFEPKMDLEFACFCKQN